MTDENTDVTAVPEVIRQAAAEDDFDTLAKYSEEEITQALADASDEGEAGEEAGVGEGEQSPRQPAEKSKDGPKEPEMAPVAALVAERQKASKLAEENAYLKGLMDANKKPLHQVPDPKQELAQIHQTRQTITSEYEDKIVAVWEEAEAGEITAAEAKRREIALQKERRAKDAEFVQKGREVYAAMNQPSPEQINALWERAEQSPVVVAESAKIDAENPWFPSISEGLKTKIVEEAQNRLEKEGITLKPVADDVIYFRQLLAKIGREWELDKIHPAAPLPKQGPSVEDRKKALLNASSQPPALPGSGVPATGSVVPDLANMSDDELSALSDKQLQEYQRFYGLG
jgi:hypothetical protein